MKKFKKKIFKFKKIFLLFFMFFQALGHGYKKKYILLSFGILLQTISEVMGVLLVIPLISLMIKPEMIYDYSIFNYAVNWTGVDNVNAYIIAITMLVCGFYILRSVLTIVFEKRQIKFLAEWEYDISKQFFANILASKYEWHVQQDTSSLIASIMENLKNIMERFVNNVMNLVSYIVVGIVMISIPLFFYPAQMLTIFLCLGLTLWLAFRYIQRVSSKANKRIAVVNAETLGILNRSLIAIREAKLTLCEHIFFDNFLHQNWKRLKVQNQILFINRLPSHLTEIIIIVIVLIFLMLSFAVSENRIEAIQSVSVLMMISFRLLPVINRGMNCIVGLMVIERTAHNFIKKVCLIKQLPRETDLMKNNNDAAIQPFPVNTQLSLVDCTYAYPNHNASDYSRATSLLPAVIHDVSLNIKRGEFIGIVGESGSGKSTLCALLTGLLYPTSGTIRADNKILTMSDIRSLRCNMGIVSQQHYVEYGTLRNNVAFGIADGDIDDVRVARCLEQAELGDLLAQHGLRMIVQHGGNNLSGGQRQRLAIARMLYRDPNIIFLDEATSSLDMIVEQKIMDVICQMKGDKTIIVIAHRISTLRRADRILVMHDGKISADGTWEDLKNTNAYFNCLLKALHSDS